MTLKSIIETHCEVCSTLHELVDTFIILTSSFFFHKRGPTSLDLYPLILPLLRQILMVTTVRAECSIFGGVRDIAGKKQCSSAPLIIVAKVCCLPVLQVSTRTRDG
jgi:hypothetical protein